MSSWDLDGRLAQEPARWLVTGGAGFIGSHLVERLLKAGHRVTVIDSLVTGYRRNVEAAIAAGGADAAARCTFVEADIADLPSCRKAVEGAQYVLHQAALGSVPRSIDDPLASHRANVDGFLNMLVAARDARVRRFVYASSSSVYGDEQTLPKVESRTGRVLSPYAATKHINEVYAGVFQRTYGLECIGLRYFNVFGPRQDPNGAYAAVIPRWVAALSEGRACDIYGDGLTSRDFCFVANAVQANLRAALAQGPGVTDTVYNVAVGEKTSLKQIYTALRDHLAATRPALKGLEARHLPERVGDIRDSQADISRARALLGYAPTHTCAQGLAELLQ